MTRNFNKKFKRYLTENVDVSDTTLIRVDHDKKIVTLCAWCDKDKSVTQQWLDRGYETSHGLCESCFNKQMEALGD